MNELWKNEMFFAPEEGGGGGSGGGEGDPDPTKSKSKGGKGDPTPLTYETLYSGLDATSRDLVDGNIEGLQGALKTERDARTKAEEDLRDVADKLEKGSEAQKEVLRLADDVAANTKRADFYEDANTAGVSNIKLAFHIATTEDMFKRRGGVDFEALKKDYPELFVMKGRKAEGGAGDGTSAELTSKGTFNDWIRRESRR
jgi:hypothetical protein